MEVSVFDEVASPVSEEGNLLLVVLVLVLMTCKDFQVGATKVFERPNLHLYPSFRSQQQKKQKKQEKKKKKKITRDSMKTPARVHARVLGNGDGPGNGNGNGNGPLSRRRQRKD